MVTKTFSIDSCNSQQRIDSISAQFFGDEASRSHLQKYGQFWLKTNENWIQKTYKSKTKPNQEWRVTYTPPTQESHLIETWETKLEILAETENWLVINKTIGVSVHPSESEKSTETVVNALMHYFGNSFSQKFETPELTHKKNLLRPGIVHRLDKTTSGALLIAKNLSTLRLLQKDWRNTKKFYTALVHGNPPNKGKITGGIMRDSKNRLRMMVSNNQKARQSTTLFEKIFPEPTTPTFITGTEKFPLVPLKIELLTGRTHQIRAHLSSIGFPIFGDELYGGQPAERIFLHAETLVFTDPHTQQTITAKAPVPHIFQTIFTQ